jgi:hypothetical protein
MKLKKLYDLGEEGLIVWESKYILETEVLRFSTQVQQGVRNKSKDAR